METARLLIDPPLDGPTNMARDEALLQGCTRTSPITLRFYAWQPATISLGYFQDFKEYELLDSPAGSLPVVRRTTGGGAILHDIELTYSIIIPIDHPLVAGRPNQLYLLMHRAIIAAIDRGSRLAGDGMVSCDASQRGPFFCFARRHTLDVVIDDPSEIDGVSKIAGSAQRRIQTAILQHGSIILDSRYRQHPVATWKLLGGPADALSAGQLLLPYLADVVGVRFVSQPWETYELDSASTFTKMYSSERWTIHRERA